MAYISTLAGVIATGRMPERWGQKHNVKKSPQERLFVFYEGFNKAKKPKQPEKK
jgi:hypothetical protein